MSHPANATVQVTAPQRRLGRSVWAVLAGFFAVVIFFSTVAISGALDIGSGERYRSRMMEILNDVAALVKDNYYDKKLKNLDWKGSVEVARNRIRKANDEGEMAAAISGLLARLNDSHTYFLRPIRLQPVIFGFRAKPFGQDARIYEIMPGGPAEKAGLQRGDEIIAIQDFAAHRWLVDEELRYFEYLDPSLTLKLKVSRSGGPPTDYIVNGTQPATSSHDFLKLYEDYQREQREQMTDVKVKDEDGGVAYVRFPTFMASSREPASLLKHARDARAIVLDLREDHGGREDTMKELIGHFFSQPIRLGTAISRDKTQEIVAKPKDPVLTAPVIVLVDSHSASAAEVTARILQMKRRATVVGDVTAGRVNRAQMFGGYGGSVYSIPYGVAITVSRFVMEDGQELEGRGVIPDVNCVPSEQDLRDDRDPCLAVALTLARQSVSNPANSTAAANDSQH